MINYSNTNAKKYFLTIATALFLVATGMQKAQAQDEGGGVTLSPAMDIVSTYVWRGTSYAGPSLQPSVELNAGNFAVGVWGSQGFDGFQEMDAYIGYSFDFGFSLGVTDYYYPPADFSDPVHAFELNAGYSAGDLSLSGNYIFAGEGAAGDDVYFEIGYDVGAASLFVGGGDGWHLEDPTAGFNIVNVGVSTVKEVEITDDFSLPIFGTAVVNPEREVFYISAGISL